MKNRLDLDRLTKQVSSAVWPCMTTFTVKWFKSLFLAVFKVNLWNRPLMPIFSTNVVSFLSTKILSNMRPFIIIVVILFSYKDGDVRYLCKVEYLLRICRHLLTQGNMIELEVFDYLDQLWKENIITTVILFSIFNIGCCFWYVKVYVAWVFVQFDSLREEL